MKHAIGQNKLFQNASLLMCFCNFALDIFELKKTQSVRSVRHVIELTFKVQISRIILRVTQTRMVFYVQATFTNLGNPNYKLFAIFLSNRCEFLSEDIATYSLQRSKRITEKRSNVTRARTKVYYCFNSKGDNFDMKQL